MSVAVAEVRRIDQMEVGNIGDELAKEHALEEMRKGHVIAFYIMGVCGLLGDGAQDSTWQHLSNIKKGHKVRAAMMPHAHAANLGIIDHDRLHPHVRNLLIKYPEKLAQITGGRTHILYPLLDEAVGRLPQYMVSTHKRDGYGQFQVFESHGTDLKAIIDALINAGVRLPVVTSLNIVDQGSITDPKEGMQFAAGSGRVNVFLVGSTSERVGSFGRIHAADLSILRTGPEIGVVLEELRRYSEEQTVATVTQR